MTDGLDEPEIVEPVNPRAGGESEGFRLTAEYWRGPAILPVSDLERLERIAPGSVERILDITVEQSRHRQGIEKTVIEGNNSRASIAQRGALLLAFTALVGGIILIALDKDTSGFITVGIVAGAFVGVNVVGRVQQRKERQAKADRIARDTPLAPQPQALPFPDAAALPNGNRRPAPEPESSD